MIFTPTPIINWHTFLDLSHERNIGLLNGRPPSSRPLRGF